MVELETSICKLLDYRLYRITPIHFLEVFERASCMSSNPIHPYNAQFQSLFLYLLQLARVTFGLSNERPSLLCAAAVYQAHATLGIIVDESFWSPTLAFYTGYEVRDLRQAVLALRGIQITAVESDSMTLNPAKVKAELTKIKETLLDATNVNNSDVFLAVLQVELIQRGVLVSDTSNVLEKVQSVAGKPLVEETSAKTPVQLLVGSCVIAGRLAERLAAATTPDNSTTATAIMSQHDLDPIRDRCQTVDDPRFLGVLDNHHAATASHFLLVAEAYYLRAAHLQTDEKPVPWKRAWDCVTARHHQQVVSWQAIPAITQLLSIAQSKDNQKRATELSLILVDCYLDDVEIEDDASKASPAWQLVHMYRPAERPKDALTKAAALLREYLNRGKSYDDVYSLLLSYRLARKQEHSSEADIYQYGGQLRDVYLKGAIPKQFSTTLYTQLRLHLEWMTEFATDDARWTRLAHFLLPLGEHWVSNPSTKTEEGDTDNIEAALCLTAALLVPQVEWMVLSNDIAPVFSVDTIEWATTVLQSRIAAGIESAKKDAIGSTNDKEDPDVAQSKAGVHGLKALLALRGDPTAERTVIETVTRSKKVHRSCGVEFGFPFLEFLVCWSGLHQHPWSTVTQAEARILIHRARECIKTAKNKRKRVPSSAEETVLQLGEADVEGSAYDSGLADRAISIYENLSADSTTYFGALIAIRSQAGLADAALKVCAFELATDSAQQTLNIVETTVTDEKHSPFWSTPDFVTIALDFQKANARRLLANTYLQSGDITSAEGVLEQAVSDSPNDSAANFALGSFRLYRSVYLESDDSNIEKQAQVQLLKAAKMDSTKAGPFALLGFWYEKKGDIKRAVGCYSKALALDPSHPVAGRGVIRLAPTSSLDAVFDKAVNVTSSSIGWAWHQVGIRKALQEGNDDLAVVAFLKTLRCRDIERPESDLLAPFFSNPSTPELPNKKEMSSTLSELAMCYRRLGRYTAAVRSFHSAIELWDEEAPPRMLCLCAQVELELGLPDDAEQKFKMAMERSDDDVAIISAFGRSAALLSMARRDAQDGKVGSAYKKLMLGIDVCSGTENCDHICFRKAAGDLHSFAASLPPDVFSIDDAPTSMDHSTAQVVFVSKGEQYYRAALDKSDDDEIRLGLATDIGSNRLLCAQLQSVAESKGLHCSVSGNVHDLFLSAADAFRSAIEMDPEYAPAWCGLGCSVIHSDPLLAQHAFVRSLELENLSPDTYANLSFLYSKHQLFRASSRISDLLSEVADTPMMWINRAAILESTGTRKEALQQASDAYSAALQVAKLPSAVAGLAMTCRYNSSIQTPISQSVLYTSEYLGSTGDTDIVLSALGTVQELEISDNTSSRHICLRTRLESLNGQLSKEQELEDIDGTLLDVEAFRWVLDGLTQDNAAAPVETSEYSLQRQVANNPSDGSLWLELSKELVSQSETKASLVAARRAVSLLLTSLHYPATKTATNPNSIVDSSELSDSLTLKFWLESLPEAGGEEEPSSPNTIDLQRALFMDPGNSVARQALRSIQ